MHPLRPGPVWGEGTFVPSRSRFISEPLRSRGEGGERERDGTWKLETAHMMILLTIPARCAQGSWRGERMRPQPTPAEMAVHHYPCCVLILVLDLFLALFLVLPCRLKQLPPPRTPLGWAGGRRRWASGPREPGGPLNPPAMPCIIFVPVSVSEKSPNSFGFFAPAPVPALLLLTGFKSTPVSLARP